MHDIPLNDTQRIFADKNHNLVYKFLHEKNLPASEYYDIVIFGYLRAVQRYLTDPNLAGYSFSTVAWRAMEGEVVNTHRTDKRRFRVIRFVRPRQSYTGHLTRRPTPTVTDEESLRESEVALLLHALAKRVTPQQMEIIRLRTKGYQTNEIAQMQNTSLYHVNTLLDNARFIVVELCRDASLHHTFLNQSLLRLRHHHMKMDRTAAFLCHRSSRSRLRQARGGSFTLSSGFSCSSAGTGCGK